MIPDLPAGTKYTIEEIDLPGGWSQKGTIEDGVIASTEVSSATATNVYAAEGDAYIVAHKKLEGDTLSDGEFTFELLDENGELIDTASNGTEDTAEETTGDNDDEYITNPWYRTAPVRFDAIHYTAPGTYHYTIVEKRGDDEKITYDAHEEKVTVTVIDAGSGVLNTSVKYDKDGALFTNKLSSGTLVLSKKTLNTTAAAAEKEFTFTVVLKDKTGAEIEGEYAYTSTERSGSVSSGGTITIKGGEAVTIEDLPHGAQYEITEASLPGWELTGTEGAAGTIEAKGTAYASFENTYTTVGSAEVTATKTMVGRTLYPNEFKFELVDMNGTVVDSAYAGADGSVKLYMDFTQADDDSTLLYTIREVQGDDPTVIYDTHESRVSVHVKDDGEGQLTGEVTYPDSNNTFTNKSMKKLTVSKKVTGNFGDATERFEFTLKLEGGDLKEVPAGASQVPGEGSESTHTYRFSLAHGEEISFEMPVDTRYEISEESSEYECKVEVSPADSATITDSTVTGTLTADTTAAYTNTKHGSVPTGVNAPVRIGLILTAIGALGAVLYLDDRRRRRNRGGRRTR